MSTKNLDVALRLYLEANGLNQGVRTAGRNYKAFTDGAARDTAMLNRTIASVRNQVAGLIAGFGVLRNQKLSGQLDKDLTQIRQTAGGTRQEMKLLRDEIFSMARDTGRPLDTLKGGFNNLIQAGLNWESARAAIRSINPASAVTGASEDVLAGGLTVAASSYGFDLAEAGVATRLLDQMTVAGRQGNAELEDLAGIFARVGVNAESANLQFEDTLGFVEALSKIERNPERLSTLADSTLRLFTNNTYKKNASKATGVSFYNPDGSGKDPMAVLEEIAAGYGKLTTDMARDRYVSKAFGQTDLDTQKGLRTLLSGDTLGQWKRISAEIRGASGTIARDLPEALDNAIDQAARLRTVMRQVGDDFAMPINRAFANAINVGVTPKEKGGLGMTDGEIIGLGAGAMVAGGLLSHIARSIPGRMKGLLGRALGDTASTAVGVAQGKALEHAAGITPVFVTNWPGNIGGGSAVDALGGAAAGGALGKFIPKGPSPLPMLAASGAFIGGFAAGSWIYNRYGDTEPAIAAGDKFGRAVDRLISVFSSDARDRLRATDPDRVDGKSFDGTIKVVLDQTGRLKVTGLDSSDNLDMRVYSGPLASGN